jgi:hypothetical protein
MEAIQRALTPSFVFEQFEGLNDDVVSALAHKSVGFLAPRLQVKPLHDVY